MCGERGAASDLSRGGGGETALVSRGFKLRKRTDGSIQARLELQHDGPRHPPRRQSLASSSCTHTRRTRRPQSSFSRDAALMPRASRSSAMSSGSWPVTLQSPVRVRKVSEGGGFGRRGESKAGGAPDGVDAGDVLVCARGTSDGGFRGGSVLWLTAGRRGPGRGGEVGKGEADRCAATLPARARE